jgi:hypothetical protein
MALHNDKPGRVCFHGSAGPFFQLLNSNANTVDQLQEKKLSVVEVQIS